MAGPPRLLATSSATTTATPSGCGWAACGVVRSGTRTSTTGSASVLSRHVLVLPDRRRIPVRGRTGTRRAAWALRNSGIMVHGQRPETIRKNQDFPISIEVQLLGGGGTGERTTANLCTPGTNVVIDGALFTTHCLNSQSKTYHGEQWVRVEAEVLGAGRITHFVNGEPVLSYEQAANRRRERHQLRPGGQEGRRAADGRLHLAAVREPPRGVPEGRAPEPGRVHGSEGEELQGVLCQGGRGELPGTRLRAAGCSLQALPGIRPGLSPTSP